MKNEAWVLRNLLETASLWADYIVIADQGSDDGSRELALTFPKVILVDNPAQVYDEGERQRLVFKAARRISGRRILIAIDADEVISANWMQSPEWLAMLDAPKGTVITFQWANLKPGMETCWIPPGDIPMGFVDDDVSSHSAGTLHVPRLPRPEGAPVLAMKAIYVLHYQYTDWARMKSKQRKYQCLEVLNHPKRRPIDIFRQYYRMDAIPEAQIHAVRDEWFAGYQELGLDVQKIALEETYRSDRETLDLLTEHGTAKFRKLAIWDTDWEALNRKFGHLARAGSLRDPRSDFEKKIHTWLAKTQPESQKSRVRWLQRALIFLGW